MRSITTGAGLAILGVCVLGAAAISSSKGNQAMAQTGSERRIVNMGVSGDGSGMAYRVWSDGVIETRCVGVVRSLSPLVGGQNYRSFIDEYGNDLISNWMVVDNGQTPSFQPTDTNTDGSVDAADIGKVLLDYGATQEVTPVPTIECQTSTIP
jgi:hypothetical protein